MASSGNRDWAFTEARRRSHAMQGAYSIYRHKRNDGDYILRAAEAVPPDAFRWQRVATIQADGTQTFDAE